MPSPSTSRFDPRRSERGFALVAAIGVLAVMAVMAAGFAASVKRETNMARNFRDAAEAKARADAGIYIAIESLLGRDPQSRLPTDGQIETLMFEGKPVRLSLQDEAGKIDLNYAPPKLIDGLLAELGVDSRARAAIDAAVQTKRIGAPSAAPYETITGASQEGPRLRDIAISPFASVDSLLMLPGMTRDTLGKIRPFLTVYGRTTHVALGTAPREVVVAIPGLRPGDAETILASRTLAMIAGQSGIPTAIAERVGAFAASLDVRAVTIVAETTTASGARVVRHAVIALTGRPYQPFRFLEWSQDFGMDSLRSTGTSGGVAVR